MDEKFGVAEQKLEVQEETPQN